MIALNIFNIKFNDFNIIYKTLYLYNYLLNINLIDLNQPSLKFNKDS